MYGLTEGGAKRTGARCGGAAARRHLRPRAVARPAVRHHRRQRDQRHRPCRRGPVRAGRQSGDRPVRRGRHPPLCRGLAAPAAEPARPRRPRRRPGRRLDVRHGHGQRHRRPASQALPHARRQLRPAACGAAHGGAAACPGLQRRRPRRGDAEDRRRLAGRPSGAGRRVRPRRAARRGRPRCRRSACARPTSTVPPTWRCRRIIRTRARSSGRRCASCCSAPGKAFVPTEEAARERALDDGVGVRRSAASRPCSSQA